MDDNFILTESQLTMIDRDINNHNNVSPGLKRNTYQQTEVCSHTEFGSDSVTVEIIDQLNYIRYASESQLQMFLICNLTQ